MYQLHVSELLSLGLIGLVVFIGYMLIGLFLLSARQHLYPDWLAEIGLKDGFLLFILHWALWPLCWLIILTHQHRLNLARRRRLL